MPSPLSRLYSTVSTSPRRTVTLCPTAAETSTSASAAPKRRAVARARAATSLIASRESGSAVEEAGTSGMGDELKSGGGRRRAYQQDAPKAADARAAGRRRGAGEALPGKARAHRPSG